MAKNHLKWQGITILFICCIMILSCESKSQEKWLPGMEINTYNGGGMVPESRTVMIKGSTGTYIHWRQPKRDTLTFKCSQQELNDLMKETNVTHFREMNSAETGGIAYDKPTTSIEFTWAGKTHSASDGATQHITSGNAAGFFKLYNYIEALVKKKLGTRY